MPRSVPRPCECVKRAWHSDRNQPMRGIIIQEIFRVVNEIHSSATKKNKEWQDKLPSVVLRAEEIMYSEAYSEAEYMDRRTLLARAIDAIDKITQRDESTEIRGFLQPCIEASLNLGCMPRQAWRSQRNDGCTDTKFPCPLRNVSEARPAPNMCPDDPLLSGNGRQTEVVPRGNFDSPTEDDCGLLLQSGPLSVPRGLESRPTRDVGDPGAGLIKYWEGSEFGDRAIKTDEDCPCFPRTNAGDSSNSQTSKWNTGNDALNAGALMRKRKAILAHGTDNRQFCSQPKLRYKYHAGSIRNAGF